MNALYGRIEMDIDHNEGSTLNLCMSTSGGALLSCTEWQEEQEVKYYWLVHKVFAPSVAVAKTRCTSQ